MNVNENIYVCINVSLLYILLEMNVNIAISETNRNKMKLLSVLVSYSVKRFGMFSPTHGQIAKKFNEAAFKTDIWASHYTL